jgi:hypothetical protein
MASSSPSSLTDSPWFWAYLFGIGGLIALALAAPKFSYRQAQEERRMQGRERAAQQQSGLEPTGELSTETETQVNLQPLFLGLAVLTSIAWFVFWFKRRSERARSAASRPPDATPHESASPPSAP